MLEREIVAAGVRWNGSTRRSHELQQLDGLVSQPKIHDANARVAYTVQLIELRPAAFGLSNFLEGENMRIEVY